VLAAPSHPDVRERISPLLISKVLRTLRTMYDFVVVDTAPAFDEQTLTALDETDECIIVATLDVPTLKNVRLSLQTLELLASLRLCSNVPGQWAVQTALVETVRVWGQLDALERDNKLDFLREPDLGFAWAAYRWAEGDDLDVVLNGVDLAAGDFVRWMKQLLDLADQVADAAGDAGLRTVARDAAKRLRRGVVAYSSVSE
jgi:ATP-dependent RNA helicase HelY